MSVAMRIQNLIGDTIEMSEARTLYCEWGIETIESGVNLPLMTPWWCIVPGSTLFGKRVVPDRRWSDGLVFSVVAGLSEASCSTS